MNEVSHRRFSFGSACIAIGVTPKTLRNWLDREEEIQLDVQRTEGGHYRFSWADIAVLAVVAQIVRGGMTVKRAYQLTGVLRDHIADLARYKNTPLQSLEAGIGALSLGFWPDESGPGFNFLWGLPGLRALGDQSAMKSLTVINPGPIFAAARFRLEEWEEGLDDNEIGPDGQLHGAVMDGAPLPDPGDKPTE